MNRRSVTIGVCAAIALLIIVALSVPNLLRVRNIPAAQYASAPREERGFYHYAASKLSNDQASDGVERQIIHTASLDLLVENVRDTASRIEAMAQGSGGYVDSSNFAESSDGIRSGQMTLRVPAGRMPDIRDQIKHLAVRVENEKTEARDVTKEIVDSEAHLRNFQAEESQYLEIMKRSGTIKDTVEVTDKLSEVRGEIEQLQFELKDLSLQVQMAAVTISLRSEKASGGSYVSWRPMQQARAAWHDMLQELADYADAMIGFLFMVPVILIWVCTLALPILLVWRTHRWLKSRTVARPS